MCYYSGHLVHIAEIRGWKMEKNKSALRISLIAVSTAIVAVFTIVIRIPVSATGGYISLVDAGVSFVSYAFGPVTGFIAGGVGTALADILGGYAQWAPVSFVVHGVEALVLGLIVKKMKSTIAVKLLAALSAVVIVSLGYLFLTSLFLVTFAEALTEVVPNIIQSGVGAIVGLGLYEAVRKGYPRLDSLRW